jgi:hypothetical protein
MSWLVVVVAAPLALAGCQSEGSSRSTLEFTPGAIRTLPALSSDAPQDGLTALPSPRSSAASVRDYFFVAQLFKMQCRHVDGGVNYCPPGTPLAPRGAFDHYQFTMQALIGFIYHAQMYTSLVTDCTGVDRAPKAVTAGSYAAASTAAGADPARFVLDQFSSYTCRSGEVSDGDAETRMVSAVADGSYQTTLHTRHEYDSGDGLPQTDFFQVDVSMEGGAPTFLALNFASAAPYRSRLVLLANVTTHRFALKYYVPSQPAEGSSWAPAHYAVAVGAGGYDLATGVPNPGHYYVDFLDEPPYGELRRCADNASGVLGSDLTACAAEGVPMEWTSSDAIRTYLAVPALHAARLAPFFSKFEDAATLGVADAWRSPGDDELYWPASLR